MKTTVLGIRLNEYQRDKLKGIAKENGVIEAELVRILLDRLIEGKIQIRNTAVFDGADISGLVKLADKKGISVQLLIDAIVEQLNESSGNKR